jgi:hypothetical protein
MTKISKLGALAGGLAAVAALAVAGAGTALAAPAGAPAARAAASREIPHRLAVLPPFASGTTTGPTDTNTSYCYEPSPLPAAIIDDPANPTCTGVATNPQIAPQFPGWGTPLSSGTTHSQWVGPQSNGEDFSEVVPGWYVYDREFSGCGVISGQAMADNEFGVFLNHQWLVDSSATSPRSFEHPISFTGTGNLSVNTVDFVVHDLSEPATGLDYLFTVTPTPCSWTVSPGGSFNAKASAVTLKDTKTGAVISCKSSDASGTLQKGKGLSSTGIGSISALSFGTCTGPVGLKLTVTPNTLPFMLNALSYKGGITGGTITGLDATVSGPSCSATVDGTAADGLDGQVAFSYSNSSGRMQDLTSGDNLTIYNVSGCAGLINSGDPLTVSATYTLSPRMTITGH